MTFDRSAVGTPSPFFQSPDERWEKGSGLGIAQAMEAANQTKTVRLRAVRLEAEAERIILAEQAIAFSPPNKVVRKRKPKAA